LSHLSHSLKELEHPRYHKILDWKPVYILKSSASSQSAINREILCR
jgi:hypothetical protein